MNIKSPDTTDISALSNLWKEAFGDTDAFLDAFFGTAFSPRRSFCITENSKAVSALYFFDCLFRGEKIAYIYAVATAKSHRSQGLCNKLMEYTHNALKEQGYKGAILVPSTPSLFDFYAKMGYKTCCHLNRYEISAGKGTETLSVISAEEYARLRKQHLPEGGVIQEGENLLFLSTYASFYKGENFLFAAHKDNATLVCYEFWGNIEKAPYILNSLECRKGIFRTAGNDIPFAMYLPFEGNCYPSYFGFAFD